MPSFNEAVSFDESLKHLMI